MTHASYLLAGYGLTGLLIASYAGWLLRRRRALAALAVAEAGDQAPSGPTP